MGGAAAFCLPHRVVTSQPSAAATLEIADLGDALFVVRGAGCNVVVARGSEGAAAMFDGGLKEHSADLLAAVRNERSISRIDTLFNSCWHPDRTGANEQLGAAGARIMAHENTRLWLGRDVTRPWDNRTIKRLPPEACPNDTFYEAGTAEVSGREVRYGYLLQAHTDGDIYVHLPGRDLLIAGDVVTVGQYPVLDYSTGGWIGGMTTAARTLVSLAGPATRVVPGTGPVQDIRHLQAEHEMLAASRDRLVKLLKSGASVDDMLAAAPTREFDAAWGDPTLFVRNAYQGLWWHARELGGVI
jgi:glyoxylase-like metal-dependent hydrolase (beta-lactamase superfamily II)